MTSRLKIVIALTGVVAVGGFFWMRSLASWRPVKVGQLDKKDSVVFLSGDEQTALLGRVGEAYARLYIKDITTGKTVPWPEGKPSYFTFSQSVPELAAFVERKGKQGELRVREVRDGRLKRAFRWSAKKPFFPTMLLGCDGKTAGILQGNSFFQWDIESGTLLHNVKLADSSALHDLGFDYVLSPDGKQLIGCAEGQGRIWDTNSGKLLRSWKTIAYNYPAFFSADGRTAAYTFLSSTEVQTYYFVDTATGSVKWKTDDHVSESSTQGNEIFFTSQTNCDVLDIFTGLVIRQLPGPRKNDGEILRVTPDWIYILNAKNEIFRWRAR